MICKSETFNKQSGPNKCTQELKKERKISCLKRDFGYDDIKQTLKCLQREKHLLKDALCCTASPHPKEKGYFRAATSKHLKEEWGHTGISLPMLCNLLVPRLFYAVPHSIVKRTARSNRAPVTKVFSVLKSSRKQIEARKGKKPKGENLLEVKFYCLGHWKGCKTEPEASQSAAILTLGKRFPSFSPTAPVLL